MYRRRLQPATFNISLINYVFFGSDSEALLGLDLTKGAARYRVLSILKLSLSTYPTLLFFLV